MRTDRERLLDMLEAIERIEKFAVCGEAAFRKVAGDDREPRRQRRAVTNGSSYTTLPDRSRVGYTKTGAFPTDRPLQLALTIA